ncbi:MAG: radical SAM protein, partial [Phycisphaerae bacterium]
AWIVGRRGPREAVTPERPHATNVERERLADGRIEDVATIFIANRECPFRCLMCDLWKYTTTTRVPDGSVAHQIESALATLPPVRHVKLYNAGSFFDPQAVPPADDAGIRDAVARMESVTVECHPRFVGPRCRAFAAALAPRLEVAMGLETVDPSVLPRLNKRMTVADFDAAAARLLDWGVSVRAFILIRAPFQTESQGVAWATRSIEHAFSVGVSCCVVIPTRAGNGAMEHLQETGLFAPPSMKGIEAVVEYGISLSKGRVLVDLWDMEKFFQCRRCGPIRMARLERMNLMQDVEPAIACGCEP